MIHRVLAILCSSTYGNALEGNSVLHKREKKTCWVERLREGTLAGYERRG